MTEEGGGCLRERASGSTTRRDTKRRGLETNEKDDDS